MVMLLRAEKNYRIVLSLYNAHVIFEIKMCMILPVDLPNWPSKTENMLIESMYSTSYLITIVIIYSTFAVGI